MVIGLTDLSMQIQRNKLLWLNLHLTVMAVCVGISTRLNFVCRMHSNVYVVVFECSNVCINVY